MASLLVMAKNNIHIDPVVDRRGCYKKGYVVVVKPDGYSPSRSEGLPTFILIHCPEVTEEQARNYMNSWEQTVDYTVNSSNLTNATYNITVFGDNLSQSGEAAITRSQVEGFLNKWNATVSSFATNSVTFDFALWQALQSAGFWNRPVESFTFTLDSYTEGTGQAVVTISELLADQITQAQRLITQKGGVVNSSTETSVTFNIHRSDVLSEFQKDVQQKTRGTWCRKQWYFSESLVDQIALIEDTFDGEGVRLTSKGQITLSQAEVLAALNDKLDE